LRRKKERRALSTNVCPADMNRLGRERGEEDAEGKRESPVGVSLLAHRKLSLQCLRNISMPSRALFSPEEKRGDHGGNGPPEYVSDQTQRAWEILTLCSARGPRRKKPKEWRKGRPLAGRREEGPGHGGTGGRCQSTGLPLPQKAGVKYKEGEVAEREGKKGVSHKRGRNRDPSGDEPRRGVNATRLFQGVPKKKRGGGADGEEL